MGNGLLNAAVEMGGGIQTLPAQLQGGKSAWRAWVEGMVDEGKEEVVQGILQRSLQNAIYQQDNPLFSTTDEGAILNPKTAAEEFAGGAAVGGILGGGQALILSRRAARPAEEYLTEREGILRDLATQKVQGEMELARRRAAPRELIRPETARELLATLGERGERAFRAAYQQESGLLPSFREFAKAYNQGLRGEPETAVEPGRSIDTMAGYFAGQNDAAAQSAARVQTQKTAPTRRAGTYRAVRPQNVELPTVPIISLSMQDVADMNGGVLPQTGNTLRKTAYDTTLRRLGLDHNEAVYIEASNVTRNGDSYVIKITKPSLKKMLSASSYANRTVPLESLAVLNQIERIAQNGVYFNSEGDRKGRLQIAGYDHLLTTVYLDGVPYVVDMRVRVEDEQTGGMNRLYHFTPEVISVTKKKDGTTSAAGRHATSVHSSDAAPSSVPIIAQTADGGNTISAQGQKVNPESGGQGMTLPGGIDTVLPGAYNGGSQTNQGGISDAGGEAEPAAGQGVPGADVRGEAGGAETMDAGVPGRSGPENGGVHQGESGTTGQAKIGAWAQGHLIKNPSGPASRASKLAQKYVPDVVIVDDSALKARNPNAWALTSEGTIYISDAVPAELADIIGYHEAVHAIRQCKNPDYIDFIGTVGSNINFMEAEPWALKLVVETRYPGKTLLELSTKELDAVYDELNALIWGYHKADPENARVQFAGIFRDYDAYIRELDAILEAAAPGDQGGREKRQKRP